MPAKHVQPADDLEEPMPRSKLPIHDEPKPAGSSLEIAVLTLCGLGAIGGGVALAAAPALSWRASQLIQSLDASLLQGSTLAICGLTLVGLSFVRRVQNRKPPNDAALLLDQVATDLVMMHGQVEDVSKRCERLAHAVETSGREIARLREQRAEEAGRGSGNEDALFGLATSLDKLGARLEQRFKGHHDALRQNLEEMNSSMVNTYQSFAQQLTAAVHEATFVPAQPPAPLPVHESVDQPEASSSSPLGLLDSFDDDGSAVKPALPASAPGIDLAQLDQVQRELAEQPRGRSWEEELQMVEASQARTKLDQLGSLLADPEVRALLDSMRHAS